MFAGGSDSVSPEVVNSDNNAARVVLYRADGSPIAAPPDPLHLELTKTTPAPAGSDIVDGTGAAIVGGDLEIRNTTAREYVIPYGEAGYRGIGIGLRFISYNQAATLRLYALYSSSPNWLGGPYSKLLDVQTALTDHRFTIGPGTVGQGGVAGGATTAAEAYYGVDALKAGFAPRKLMLYIVFATAPTAGEHYISITRTR